MKKLLLLTTITLLTLSTFSQIDSTKIDSINQANETLKKQVELFQTGSITLDSVLTDTVLMFVLYNNADMDVKTDTCIVVKRAQKAKIVNINDTSNQLQPEWYVYQVFHLRNRRQIPNSYIWNFKEIKQ